MSIKEIELQKVVAGMDVGKRQDHSVITVIEQWQEFEYRDLGGGKHAIGKPVYEIADQHRLALDTPHNVQVDYVTRLINNARAEYGKSITLIIDASGIGENHFDNFVERGLNVFGIITVKSGLKVGYTRRHFTVPQDDITAALTVVMENKRLAIPDDLPFKDVLIKELATFTWKQKGSGFKAEHESGGHDDTVKALNYPIWWCERNQGKRIKTVFSKRELGIKG